MLFDDVPIGFAELAEVVAPPRQLLMLLAIPDCAPCVAMKSALSDARLLTEMPKLHRLVFDDVEIPTDRVAALLGRHTTIFPSLFFQNREGRRHWIKGMADKSGPFDATRLAAWIDAKR